MSNPSGDKYRVFVYGTSGILGIYGTTEFILKLSIKPEV